jgi:tetratricopeptide (TPR) repeat protein
MSGSEKLWMMRIGDHICGPYSTTSVEALIREQRVSEVDEVALPCKGWVYVRDQEEFLSALNIVKTESFSSFDKSSSADSQGTQTENVTEISDADKTEELHSVGMGGETQTVPLSEINNDEGLGDFQPELVNKKNKQKKKKVSFLLSFAFFGIVAFILLSSKTLDYSSISFWGGKNKKEFQIAWESGDYQSATRALLSDESLLRKNQEKYAALLLMRKNDFNLAGQSLSMVEDKTSAEWKNLKGLSKHYNKKGDEAGGFYLSALKTDPEYIASLVNLGHLKRQSGEWSQSRMYFESVFSRSPEVGYDDVAFHLLEAWMRESLAESGYSNLNRVEPYLQNQLIGFSTYEHELRLVDLWIRSARKKWDVPEEELTQALLNLDPHVLIKRKLSPYTYKLAEGELSYLCSDLEARLVPNTQKNSVIALCHIVDKNYKLAAELLEKDLESEQAVTLYSFVNKILGNDDLANEYLTKAMEFNKDEVFTKFFLQAEFCYEKGDMKCSANYWMKALSRNANAFTAHTGLARSYFQVEDYDRSRTFMDRALAFSKSYGPLIELQIRMKEATQ